MYTTFYKVVQTNDPFCAGNKIVHRNKKPWKVELNHYSYAEERSMSSGRHDSLLPVVDLWGSRKYNSDRNSTIFHLVRQRYKHGGHIERAFERERKTCFVPFPNSDVSNDETKLQ